MRVTGYMDGVAYTLSTGGGNGEDGVVNAASPVLVYAKIASAEGVDVPLTSVGPVVKAGFDSDEAVLAALMHTTEVVAVVDGPTAPATAERVDH